MTDKRKVPKKKIIVVGGGFGGVKAALELCKDKRLEVTLVSERPDFFYYPTLYKTATGGSSEESVIPLGEIFADKPVDLYEEKIVAIDKAAKIIISENGHNIQYDVVIFAIGVVTNYFGIEGLKEHAFGIKSLVEAERLKRHLHAQLIADDKPDANYIVVGGGPTGIELAGALGGYIREIMKKHGIKKQRIHIDLVEAMPRLMPRMPKHVGRRITHRLRKLGIKVYLGKKVEGASTEELHVSGKPIRSHTIVWTAGVANNPFFDNNPFALSPRKKVIVDEFLRADKDVYVIGDNAETKYSGMAQTALFDGEFVAQNIRRELDDTPKLAYAAKEPIYITPVGPGWASVLWGKVNINGRLGWLLRSVADARGFMELQPFLDAADQFMSSFEREDMCPLCSEADSQDN